MKKYLLYIFNDNNIHIIIKAIKVKIYKLFI